LHIPLVVLALNLTAVPAAAAILQVGPGKPYATPCRAFAAAADGDVIEISADGNYTGDVCNILRNRLTIRGVGGRPRIDAGGRYSEGKGIWVIKGADTVVENIELSGARVPDKNGAGIRQEGTHLTVRRCYFHDNENGILTNPNTASQILIEHSEFANNGYGDGSSHNVYIHRVARLIFRYNYSHRSYVGHLLKTRAAENYILYNRLTGENGTQSYELDVPNGGRTYVIGNLFHQGQTTSNSHLIAYQMEGALHPSSELFVVNNTFVNTRSPGGYFINIHSSVTTPALIQNNIFSGLGTITTQTTAVQTSNFVGDPLFVDRVTYNFRLRPDSPCINVGTAPGTGAGYNLTPMFQYVPVAMTEPRPLAGTIDIGAYEYVPAPVQGPALLEE
jgi:hypothetical protein